MPHSSLIGRYLAARARFAKAGDTGMVRECDFNLQRLGYQPDAAPAELVRVEERAETEARPRRGRPPARRDQELSA